MRNDSAMAESGTAGAGLQPFDGLRLWHGVLSGLVRSDAPDLTQRQLALLLTVYLSPPPHTVRGLSARLNMSKPAVTRALDTLGRLGFLRRRRDPDDRRNVLVQRTVAGSVFLSEFGEDIARLAATNGKAADTDHDDAL
jgi:DNA-binding MarR family transcriptional regulator